MDETTWAALALVLTLLFGGYAFWAFRTRGMAAGLRGLALALIPPAAWATGTLEMFTRIVNAVVDWITDFVFSPLSWAGIGLAGIAVVLYVVGGMVRSRSSETTKGQAVGGDAGAPRKPLPPGRKTRSEPVIDPELAEIEALLKKRGIT